MTSPSNKALKARVEELERLLIDLNGKLDQYWMQKSEANTIAVCAVQFECRAALASEAKR